MGGTLKLVSGDGLAGPGKIFSGGKADDEWHKPWLRSSKRGAFQAKGSTFTISVTYIWALPGWFGALF